MYVTCLCACNVSECACNVSECACNVSECACNVSKCVCDVSKCACNVSECACNVSKCACDVSMMVKIRDAKIHEIDACLQAELLARTKTNNTVLIVVEKYRVHNGQKYRVHNGQKVRNKRDCTGFSCLLKCSLARTNDYILVLAILYVCLCDLHRYLLLYRIVYKYVCMYVCMFM